MASVCWWRSADCLMTTNRYCGYCGYCAVLFFLSLQYCTYCTKSWKKNIDAQRYQHRCTTWSGSFPQLMVERVYVWLPLSLLLLDLVCNLWPHSAQCTHKKKSTYRIHRFCLRGVVFVLGLFGVDLKIARSMMHGVKCCDFFHFDHFTPLPTTRTSCSLDSHATSLFSLFV